MTLFLKNDAGQGLIEYALIIGLIAIVSVTALAFFGIRTDDTLSNAANAPLQTPGEVHPPLHNPIPRVESAL